MLKLANSITSSNTIITFSEKKLKPNKIYR